MEKQDVHDLQMDFVETRKKYIRTIAKLERQNSKIEVELLKSTKYELDKSIPEKFVCTVSLDERLLNEIKPDTTYYDAKLLELKHKSNMLMKAAKYKNRSQQSKLYQNVNISIE